LKVGAVLRLLRPAHWVKNSFVLAGVFFAARWRQPDVLLHALLAFAAFCLAASAAYAWNDVRDAAQDRLHPRKRLRPVAAGEVSAATALALAAVLALTSLLLAASVSAPLLGVLIAYLAINAYYSVDGKDRVLLDVFCIASGFILRLLAGTWGIGVEPSQWFLLCTLALSLFLGFSKRYAELTDGALDPAGRRAVLRSYSRDFLLVLLAVTLSATLIMYGLYTTSAHTVEVHGSDHLIFTLPLAMYGMFRYLYLVMREGFGENLVADILRDRQMIAVVLLYGVAAGAILALGSPLAP
jgi:4-hydroxybenzoate polyprenyltransferase